MTIDQEAIKRIAELELLARTTVDGFLSGRHRSRFRGASLEFAQHREYVPGDDLRHLDWKVWGRADRLTVKQYEAETNVAALFAVDASGSMAYGEGDHNKYTCACRIAACLSYLLLRQSDAVGLSLFQEDFMAELPHRTGRPQFHAMTAALAGVHPQGAGELPTRLREWASRSAPRGIRIVLSDFYGDPRAISAAVAALRKRGHDVLALHVLHADELDLPFDRFTEFVGLEIPVELRCDPTALREAYRIVVADHCRELQRRLIAMGVQYRRLLTNQPLGEALALVLLERMRA